VSDDRDVREFPVFDGSVFDGEDLAALNETYAPVLDSPFMLPDFSVEIIAPEAPSSFNFRSFSPLAQVFGARRGTPHPQRRDVSRHVRFADFAPVTLTVDNLLPPPVVEPVAEAIVHAVPEPVLWPPQSRFGDLSAVALAQFMAAGASRFLRVETPAPEPEAIVAEAAPVTFAEILPEFTGELPAADVITDAVTPPAAIDAAIFEPATEIAAETAPMAAQAEQKVADQIIQSMTEQLQAVAGQIVQAVTDQLAALQQQPAPAAKETAAVVQEPAAPETTPKPRSTLSLKSKPPSITLGENGTVSAAASVFLKDRKTEEPSAVATAARRKLTNSRHFSRISSRSSTEDLVAAFRAEMAMLDKIKADNAGGMPIDPPEQAERKTHPLAKKSWAELLAELDRAPEKIKPEFDFAAAFRAEMEATLAKQDPAAEQPKKPVSRKAEPHRTRILAA
jgi:hypothetical protein